MGGVNSLWADDAYFGSETKVCGAWDASSKSKTYAIPKNGSLTINFTISTNTDTENYPTWEKWYTWLIDVYCNGWQFAFRADNEDGSNWHGSLQPTITYSNNFEQKYTRDNMDGANVVLEISRNASNEVTVLATTTKGSDTWWKKEVITLSEGAGDNDLTFYLTGDNCYGEIHSAVGDKNVGTTENVTSWWNNFSEYYTIEANKMLTLNFKNYSSKTKNWNNFVIVITNDNDRGATGYAEQVVIRTDDYGWGTYYNHANFSNNYNWDSYIDDLDGADVELIIKRYDTKVIIKATYTTTGGVVYYQQYVYTSPSGSDPLRAFLTVDNSHISNLTSEITDSPTPNVYQYTVNAVDGSSNILKQLKSGSVYEGETVNMDYPRFVLSGTTLYSSGTGAVSYSTSFTPGADNYVKNITYNSGTINNVAYYTEGENVSGASEGSNAARASMGKMGYTGSSSTYLDVTTLAPGKYVLYSRGQNGNSAARAFSFKVGDTEVFSGSITNGTNQDSNSSEFTVSSDAKLSFACEGSSISGMDYFYVVKTGVTVTIASSGYSSLASAYGLDFANATGLTAAYVVTKTTNDAVTLTSVDELPANSGVILKGESGATYSIPVKADATYSGTNLLSAAVTATHITANSAYILQGGQFHLVTADSDVPAGKAYLLANNVQTAARALGFMFSNEVEGISAVSLDKQNGEFYNLQGQRVDSPKKGLYIVNGTKVIIK